MAPAAPAMHNYVLRYATAVTGLIVCRWNPPQPAYLRFAHYKPIEVLHSSLRSGSMRLSSCAVATFIFLAQLVRPAPLAPRHADAQPRAGDSEAQVAAQFQHRRAASYSVVQVYGSSLPTSTVTTTTTVYKTIIEQETTTNAVALVQETETITYTGIVTRPSTTQTLTFTTTVVFKEESTLQVTGTSASTSASTSSSSSDTMSQTITASAKSPYTLVQVTETLVLTTAISISQGSETFTITATEVFTDSTIAPALLSSSTTTSGARSVLTTLVTETFPAQTFVASLVAEGPNGSLTFVPVTTVLSPSTFITSTVLTASVTPLETTSLLESSNTAAAPIITIASSSQSHMPTASPTTTIDTLWRNVTVAATPVSSVSVSARSLSSGPFRYLFA